MIVLATSLQVACSSPNRGEWKGTFDGDTSGVVEFSINTRGTKLRGSMDGTLSSGEPFKAKIEGLLRQDYIDATFKGAAIVGQGLPLTFDGAMRGTLGNSQGQGDWQASLKITATELAGTWQVDQADPIH